MSEEQFVEEGHAQIYSSYRKDTPCQLVEKIISFVKEKQDGPLKVAVDVGCGSGQSTVSFSPHFEHIYGLDVSEAQVRQAQASRRLHNLEYRVSSAEKLLFDDSSVQLLTVATALHWFDTDRFMAEARRVLCSNGVLAVYGYISMKLVLEDPEQMKEVDEIYEEYYKTLEPYMHPNIHILVKDRYKSINFPFEDVIRMEDIRCPFQGCLRDIGNYASTYSGLQNYMKADPAGADACIGRFRKRLYDIGAAINIQPDDITTLFQDFVLILCRKKEA